MTQGHVIYVVHVMSTLILIHVGFAFTLLFSGNFGGLGVTWVCHGLLVLTLVLPFLNLYCQD